MTESLLYRIRRLSASLVASGVLALLGASCGDEPFRSCPDPTQSYIDQDQRCYCRSESARFVDGPLACAACDSQDSQGIYCICQDKSLIDVALASCLDCPSGACEERECDPPGCDGACGHPPCAAGALCNAEGFCESCEERCGPGCPCAPGQTCVSGQCLEVTRCCKNTSLCPSAQADWCVAPGLYPLGTSCGCRYVYPDGSFCDESGSFCEF